ncbi:MAG: GAF and ANTAR domain-containing protein [Nocardioides sp.]
MISTEHMSDLFVEVADTLVDEFDVVDFLHNLTVHAATISGAQAAGLMLTDQMGRLQFMAASHPGGEALELFQLQNSEGPCLDCFTTGEPIVNADLTRATDRWPTFAPRARQLGFQSVHAFPMRLRDNVIGALNLFGAATASFDETEVRLVQALADVATIALMQERAIRRAEELTEQLQGALTSRVVIEQAKGALAALLGISPEEAFEVLRTRARSHQQRLAEVAQAVLDGRYDPGELPRAE